jgi:hypothetical protein
MSLLEQASIWIAETGPMTALRESEIVFPLVQTVHIVGLGLLAGTIAILDLRLLGLVLRDQPADRLARQLLPFTWSGFAIMAGSGSLLFAAQAEKVWSNVYLQIKLVLLLIAGLNMLAFHLTSYRRVSEWGTIGAEHPAAVKAAAAGSLLLWAGIITAGRFVAYFA